MFGLCLHCINLNVDYAHIAICKTKLIKRNTASFAIHSTSFFTKTFEKTSRSREFKHRQAEVFRLAKVSVSRTTYHVPTFFTFELFSQRGKRIADSHLLDSQTRFTIFRLLPSLESSPLLFPKETSGTEKSSGLKNLSRVSPCLCL